ncbi:MAG TPA: hemerythrin domain-containing protein [Gammaproteobacteria bacterium]|nr:hemerythrin domain-containing protein [Gammaproteobacteria bacterium]
MDADPEQALVWAREVRVRLERYPRNSWREDATHGARFWLEIHDGFRREAGGLIALADEHRSGRRTAAQLAVVSAPRLNGMIARLRDHHEIEEFEYFPAFRVLEPKLAPGFDVLANDHARLQRHVDETVAALAELLAAVANDSAGMPRVTDHYAARAGELCRALERHLDDEEDLIIPLLLERR